MVHVCKQNCFHCTRRTSPKKSRRTLIAAIKDVELLEDLGNGSKTKGLEILLEKIQFSEKPTKKESYAAFFISNENFTKLRQLGEGNASEGLRCLMYRHRKNF